MPILLLPKFCQECVRFDIWPGSIKVCFASVYIDISSHESLICWYHYQSVLNYVPRVPSCRTCPMCLCALQAYMFTCSRALRARHGCVPSCLYVLTCLTCPHFFTCLMCLHVLRAYILSMYMLIKFTQINELLSTFIRYFYIYKTGVIFYMTFSLFETKNINYF